MNPTLKQLAGEVRDGRDDQVAQPLAVRHDLLRQLDEEGDERPVQRP